MMLWGKVSVRQTREQRIIRYAAEDSRFEIESRRRKVPHANDSGYWYHTTYFLIDTATGFEREFWKLADAKQAAEDMLK